MKDEFPQYRRYKNGRSYFEISSENQLKEIQIAGKKFHQYLLQAKIYPEKMLIQDLLKMDNDGVEKITKVEFYAFLEKCKLELTEII